MRGVGGGTELPRGGSSREGAAVVEYGRDFRAALGGIGAWVGQSTMK